MFFTADADFRSSQLARVQCLLMSSAQVVGRSKMEMLGSLLCRCTVCRNEMRASSNIVDLERLFFDLDATPGWRLQQSPVECPQASVLTRSWGLMPRERGQARVLSYWFGSPSPSHTPGSSRRSAPRKHCLHPLLATSFNLPLTSGLEISSPSVLLPFQGLSV